MGVYFRTGKGSAVGFPWWFYLLVVLPLQVCYWFVVATVWLVVAAATVVASGVALAVEWWRNRQRRPTL